MKTDTTPAPRHSIFTGQTNSVEALSATKVQVKLMELETVLEIVPGVVVLRAF